MRESPGLQNALAALATDADWAASVALEPAELSARFELEPHEAKALAAIPADELTRYAQGLVNKRLRGVLKQMPLSLKLCPHLRGWVRDWLVKHPRRGASELSPGARDALEALPSLCRSVANGELTYLPDLLTFEVLRCCSRSDGVERRVQLRFDLVALTAQLRAGVIPLEPDPAPQTYAFDADGARVAHLPVTTAEALEARDARERAPAPPPSGFLGVGLGFRREFAEAVRQLPPDVLEIIPDHFFADPEELAELGARSALVLHDVLCSFGTVGDNVAFIAQLDRIRELMRYARPALFSDHLAMTRAPNGIDIGHLAPVLLDEAALTRIGDRVKRAQDRLDVDVALENIFAPFELPGTIPEPEFFHRLTEATGCGLLMDLTNLLYNAKNRGVDPRQLLRQYPLHAVRQVHLAGGVQEPSGRWVDSHSHPVEADALTLLDEIDGHGLRALIIERDMHLPPYAELLAEAHHARELWDQRHPGGEHESC